MSRVEHEACYSVVTHLDCKSLVPLIFCPDSVSILTINEPRSQYKILLNAYITMFYVRSLMYESYFASAKRLKSLLKTNPQAKPLTITSRHPKRRKYALGPVKTHRQIISIIQKRRLPRITSHEKLLCERRPLTQLRGKR